MSRLCCATGEQEFTVCRRSTRSDNCKSRHFPLSFCSHFANGAFPQSRKEFFPQVLILHKILDVKVQRMSRAGSDPGGGTCQLLGTRCPHCGRFAIANHRDLTSQLLMKTRELRHQQSAGQAAIFYDCVSTLLVGKICKAGSTVVVQEWDWSRQDLLLLNAMEQHEVVFRQPP